MHNNIIYFAVLKCYIYPLKTLFCHIAVFLVSCSSEKYVHMKTCMLIYILYVNRYMEETEEKEIAWHNDGKLQGIYFKHNENL